MKTFLQICAFIALLSVTGCAREGCTDPSACNYNPKATKSDYSCTYSGCGGGGGNCTYTNWTGTGSCNTSGYYPVYTNRCCSSSYPYYNTSSDDCHSTCSGAENASSYGSVYYINYNGGGGGTCYYTQWTGTGSCANSGYYPVYSGKCCSYSYPYYNTYTNQCYTTCSSARSASSSGSIYKINY